MRTNRTFYHFIALSALLTGAILMIPFIAMQFSSEVVWTPSDFIFAGTLLFGTSVTYKLVTRRSDDMLYSLAIGFALLTGFFLIWTNLAVGINGSEENPINLLYFGVIFIGIIGSLLARFRSKEMALTMFSMAIAHVLVTSIALINGFDSSAPNTLFQLIAINGFFIILFVASALLFRYVAQRSTSYLE